MWWLNLLDEYESEIPNHVVIPKMIKDIHLSRNQVGSFIIGNNDSIQITGIPENEESLTFINCCFELCPKDLYYLKNLKSINFINCNLLKSITGLSALKYLESISIKNCKEIFSISDLKDSGSLRFLYLFNCPKLTQIHGMKYLHNLETVMIGRCPYIDFSDLNKLKKLIFFHFFYYENMDFSNLKDLVLKGCYFHAGLNWKHSLPSEIDYSEAFSCVCTESQVHGFVDTHKAYRIMYNYFVREEEKTKCNKC